MKKCPTCDKTYEDSMRFCQVDGTALVDAPAFDPFATIVGVTPPKPKPETAEAPFVPQPEEPEAISEPENILDLPESDPLKTMYVSDDEMQAALRPDNVTPEPGIVEIPPIDDRPSAEDQMSAAEPAPPAQPEPPASAPEPEPPSFNVPNVPAPNFGDISPPPSPFSAGNEADRPVSAPSFDESAAEQKPFNEAETIIQPGYPNPFEEAPAAPVAEWTPQPAAEPSWENQQAGSNVPFQPPAATAPAGQSQALAIGSLVVGILSLVCCNWFVFGIAAIVMGFIAKNKADSDPNRYGGRGLALGGMITGAISVVLGVLVWILYFVGALAGVLTSVGQ